MPHHFSAQEIADYDQGLAKANHDLDILVTGLQEQTSELGSMQAMSNLALALMNFLDKDRKDNLMFAALKRLAEQEPRSCD
jgi:hypothetical protein